MQSRKFGNGRGRRRADCIRQQARAPHKPCTASGRPLTREVPAVSKRLEICLPAPQLPPGIDALQKKGISADYMSFSFIMTAWFRELLSVVFNMQIQGV